MMTASNIHYEYADRARGLGPGGIGALFLPAQRIELVKDIDRDLHLLKRHSPYHESDHVLNIALNLLAGGRRMEHLELRRNDEVYLDALGADRIPDPTTAGDFRRRYHEADVLTSMDTINGSRLRVRARQPSESFEGAILEADGSIVPSDGECEREMDFAYDGRYGYHPLSISLANTAEPLFLLDRSGNRPSQEQADVFLDKAIALCRRAGFRSILLRGDTEFARTKHLDRWDAAGDIRFVFGYEAYDGLKARADDLPAAAYRLLRRPRRPIKTAERRKPERVEAAIVRERGYENIEPLEEMVAEFAYRPTACRKGYRMIVLRERVEVGKGQRRLFEEYRYFFYITNDRTMTAEEVVFSANDRRDQENLIAQLKGGVHAPKAPVGDLVSNWAYMVMGSLAWSLKAWSALLVPVVARHGVEHTAEKRTLSRMEFATYRAAFIEMPCQLVRSGGRLIYRLLSWDPWQGAFLRSVERLNGSWQC